MIIDGRRARGELPTDFDVCVVGSGPAGMSVAGSLAERGLRVGVIEGGGARATLRGQRRLVDVPTGTPYWNLAAVRTRMIGGSGNRWGGISRPLDPLDFAERSWVEGSGWPIGFADLAGHFRRAAEVLALPPEEPAASPADEPTTSSFTVANYRLSPRLRFADGLESTSATVLSNLEVATLRLHPHSNRIVSLEACATGGRRHEITARRFVLAAGGIENARLLLASPGRDGVELGNEHDVVGRYFMEHLHAPVAEIVPAGALSSWHSYSIDGWPRLVRSIVPTEQLQSDRKLLNASLSIGPLGYVGHPPFADRDYRLGFAIDRAFTALAARGITPKLPRRRRRPSGDLAKLVVYRGEQPPQRDNRVVLGERRDEFGRRLPHLNWTVGPREAANVDAVLGAFREAVTENGWGELGPQLPDWREKIIGGPHHMGTTRMSGDPRTGVVDSDCRVHSVENLYVAGSSVFTTGGHANPTMTIVALALRLADHLAGLPRSG